MRTRRVGAALGLAVAVSSIATLADATSAAGPDGLPVGFESSDECDSAPGVTDDSIDLGVIIDLSGPTAGGAVVWATSFQAYFAAANAAGGVAGRQVNVVVEDSKYDPSVHSAALESIGDDVLTVGLSWGTPNVTAVNPAMTERCMATVAGSFGLGAASLPGVALVGTPYSIDAINAVSHVQATVTPAPTRWATLVLPGEIEREVTGALDHMSEAAGIDVVETITLSATDQDLSAYVSRLRAADPEYVYLAVLPNQVAQILTALQDTDIQFVIFSSGFLNGMLEVVDPAVYEGTLVVTGFPTYSSDTAGAEAARAAIAEFAPDTAPEFTALDGWRAGALIANAIEQADAAGDLTRGGLAEHLFAVTETDVGDLGQVLSFGQEGLPPGVPSRASRLFSVDPESIDGLVPVTDFVVSPEAAAWTPAS